MAESTRRLSIILAAKDRVTSVLGRVRGAVVGFAKVIAVGAALAVGALTAGLAALTVRAFGTIDALSKTADIVNATTEGLVAMRHAANLSGVGAEQLDGALARMSRNLGDFSNGVGTAKRSLEALGFTQNELLGKKADEQYALIADRIAQITDPAKQAAAAYEIFGKQGQKLLPMLRQGSAGLAAAREEADRLGITFSRLDGAKIEQANDAISTMKAAAAGIGQQLAIQFAPFVTAVANGVTYLLTTVRPWLVSFITEGIALFKRFVAFVAPLIITWVGVLRAEFAFLGDIVMELWGGVKWVLEALGVNLDGFTGNLTTWREMLQEILLRVEFGFRNWREYLQLAVDMAILSVIRFANQVKHFFTTAIPEYLKWLERNWLNILITIGANTLTLFENLAGNVVNIIKNIPALIRGEVSFSDLWKPMTEGFLTVIEELPEVAERKIEGLEAMLADKVAKSQKSLGDKYEKFAAERREQINADAAKFASVFDFKGSAPTAPGGGDGDGAPAAAGRGASGGGGDQGTSLLRLSGRFLGLRERASAGEDPQKIVAKNSSQQVALLGKGIKTTERLIEMVRRGGGGGIPLLG